MPDTAAMTFQPALRRGALWMGVSLVCFTANALLLRHTTGAGGDASAWLALLFRAVGGVGVVWLMSLRGARVDFRRAITVPLLVSRGIMGALGTAAYYLTIGPLGPGKATLIGNTWVIWSALMAATVLHEKLSPQKLLGIAIAISGLALLTGVDHGALGRFGRHELVAIGGALIAAATVVVIRQLTRTETSATIFTSQCAYTALLALPFAMLRWHAPATATIALLTLAAALAAVGQLAMTEGFRHLPVAVGGAFQVVLPLFITLGGWALFDETFTLAQSGGAALILAGGFITVVAGGIRAKARVPR